MGPKIAVEDLYSINRNARRTVLIVNDQSCDFILTGGRRSQRGGGVRRLEEAATMRSYFYVFDSAGWFSASATLTARA